MNGGPVSWNHNDSSFATILQHLENDDAQNDDAEKSNMKNENVKLDEEMREDETMDRQDIQGTKNKAHKVNNASSLQPHAHDCIMTWSSGMICSV